MSIRFPETTKSRVGHPSVPAVGAFAAAAGGILMAGIAMERAGVISLPFNIASASVPSPIITEPPYPEPQIPVQRLDPAVTVLLQDPILQESMRQGIRVIITEAVPGSPKEKWTLGADKTSGNNERSTPIITNNILTTFEAKSKILAYRILEAILKGSFATVRWAQTESGWVNVRRNSQINLGEDQEFGDTPASIRTRVVYDSANPSK